jgi:hypothetical protein
MGNRLDNQVLRMRIERMRERNKWWVSIGFGLLALTGIALGKGAAASTLVFLGAGWLAFLILGGTHMAQIRAAKRTFVEQGGQL